MTEIYAALAAMGIAIAFAGVGLAAATIDTKIASRARCKAQRRACMMVHGQPQRPGR